nr:RNA-directed DNA polymerase, eukaryota, reverse transcriptase zinc-binding domain protein [Tanacetum cinerariifolium]
IYGTWLPSNSKVLFVAIYAPQQVSHKRILWDYVSTLIDRWNGEVVVLGDFNEVRNIDERCGSCFNPTSARVFDQFISASGLVDVKMEGIRAWIKDKRLSVSGEKDSIKKELSDIDRLLDGGDVFDSNFLRRSELHRNLYNINQMESKEYLQKSKIKWAIEGDENSNFFHGLINKKCSHLAIRRVFVDDICKMLSDVQASDLERRVPREEIRLAVWNYGENKYPGPDGYSFDFFKKYWNFVSSDLWSVYKVVTKVLANRLALVILDLISDTQSVFVANRQILDGPFILKELLHWCKRKKKQVMFFKVDFAKAYDSVRWDYLLDVLEAFRFGNIWCKWIRGTFSSAKASILVNGSPIIEFPFHCGLKQDDPLSPYLFILIMESFNMSFTRAIDEGVFKGVHLHGSTFISFFYADDVMFIGEWSDDNLKECMSRHNAWASMVDKLRSRLSKWKVKTLSISGRLTRLKAVLGASPLYNMSIFKVPKGILNSMEAIRSKFFNGMEPLTNKITWAAWNKVLASKENGGLDGSLWFRVIKALYGTSIDSHLVNLSSNWCSIIYELHLLVGKGFHFLDHCKKRIENGRDTCFWYDNWLGDKPLKDLFPCLFALELNKEVTFADKVQGVVPSSSRRPVRAGSEYQHLTDLNLLMDSVSLSHSCDRWVCDLSGDGEFRVKEVRNFLDNLFLSFYADATRWVKYILIKINVFVWRVRRDFLPTRVNISRRGILLELSSSPLCLSSEKNIHHVLFGCGLAENIFRRICRWWELDWQALESFSDWNYWFSWIRLSSKIKALLEGVLCVAWWSIWGSRNRTIYNEMPPRRSVLFDDIVSLSFNWFSSRYNRAITWDSWLKNPHLISL